MCFTEAGRDAEKQAAAKMRTEKILPFSMRRNERRPYRADKDGPGVNGIRLRTSRWNFGPAVYEIAQINI